MKNVLCYGDSNTWGSNPADGTRYGLNERWPGVLRNALGDAYWVIEEGLGGRTTVWDDPIEGHKNGKTYLPPSLNSHKPLDLVIIMLGTNDLKMRFSVPVFDVANSVGALVDIVRKSETGINDGAPQVLVIAPPPFAELTGFAEMFKGGADKAAQLGVEYARMADERGCAFVNAGDVIVSSAIDGIHFEVDEHRKLGEAVAKKVRELIG